MSAYQGYVYLPLEIVVLPLSYPMPIGQSFRDSNLMPARWPVRCR